MTTSLIGASIPRIEGPDKVTGRTRYAADVPITGVLHGKILRSPHPHARIVRVDISRAREVPGVKAVLTGADVRDHYVGKTLRDMPVLCWDTVRFIGDRVAAVAAETLEAAEAGIQAIIVEYEVLDGVSNPVEAMRPEAPLLHEDVTRYAGPPPERLAADIHNGSTRLFWRRGNPERGFSEADLVLEHHFRIPARSQGYLEPHVNTVDIATDGVIHLWASCKTPFRGRMQFAAAIDVQPEQIVVHAVSVGGDFGGKGDVVEAPVAYYLAKQAGRPVTIAMTSAEDLAASNPDQYTEVTIRSGVMRDGRIVARTMHTVHACGAYAALKPNGAYSTWHQVGGCYQIPNGEYEFLQIYTNTAPGGYFRAPGAHQFIFATECHTDLLAAELGMDPAEFRMKNFMNEGEDDAIGTRMDHLKAREVLQAALDAADWYNPTRRPNSGRGLALFGRQIGGGPSGVILTAELDGSISLLSPTIDVGTGTHTIVQQLAADDLGLPLTKVSVRVGDSDVVPFDEGPRASRVTYTEGTAVMMACAELRQRLAEPAAELLGCPVGDVEYRDGKFHGDGHSVDLAQVTAIADDGKPVTVRIERVAPEQDDVRYYCAQVAEVEADPETGQVTVLRLITAHDVGAIINPVTHQGQIDGGATTGFGMALTEEFVIEDGRTINANLGDYKMPTVADIPPLETILVHSGGGRGPHGAKAIGEWSNNAPPAAIANAVADAVGARLFELPLTAERVFRALKDG
ncbi:MAG: xanthine dehydrogenase family protein molybdopterin-binding subunit [Chloroflexota bacterium]